MEAIMGMKPSILAAASVRKKQEKCQQINITAFAKKMKARRTLRSEGCCDVYHQNQLRRNGTEVRKHPKRVFRLFVFYLVRRWGIIYSDKIDKRAAGIMLHDTVEDVSEKIFENIERDYGPVTLDFVKALTRKKGESMIRYLRRVIESLLKILAKLCDSIDNLLGMLDEYYEGLPSATLERLETYTKEKVFPLLVIVSILDLRPSEYMGPVQEAFNDLRLCYREAQEAIAIAKKEQRK